MKNLWSGLPGWHPAQVLAAPALVRALVLRQVDKRRDESRRGRHKCPRHPGIHNLSNDLWRKLVGTGELKLIAVTKAQAPQKTMQHWPKRSESGGAVTTQQTAA